MAPQRLAQFLKLSEMAQQNHHEQSLADWVNEGGATSSQRDEFDARRVTRIQQRETPMNHVPVFIPVLLILALIVVTIYRPGPASDGLLQKASIVCETWMRK